MELLNDLLRLLLPLLKAGLVLALPMVALSIGHVLLKLVAPKEYFVIPILALLARVAGVVLGGLLLYTNLDGRCFDLQELFIPSSLWNLSFHQFLVDRANPAAFRWMPIIDSMRDAADIAVILPAAVAAGVSATSVFLAFRLWAWRDALRAILASGGIFVWAITLTVYLVCLMFWALHMLNFWSLAIFAAYYQYRRSQD